MSSKTLPFSYKMTAYAQQLDANDQPLPVMIGPFDAVELSVKLNINIERMISYKVEDDGQTRHSIPRLESTDIKMNINAASSEMLAMLLAGTETTLSVGSGTVTGESITLIHDTWVKTAQDNISAVAIQETPAPTLGTDYLLDEEIGAIMSLSTGSLANNLATTVNYSHGAIDGVQIAAGSSLNSYFQIVGRGVNRATGQKGKLLIPKSRIISDSEMYLLSKEAKDASLIIDSVIKSGHITTVYWNDQLLYS